jgi:hypothetical protein
MKQFLLSLLAFLCCFALSSQTIPQGTSPFTTLSSSNITQDGTSGYVGIGQASPSGNLDVYASSAPYTLDGPINPVSVIISEISVPAFSEGIEGPVAPPLEANAPYAYTAISNTCTWVPPTTVGYEVFPGHFDCSDGPVQTINFSVNGLGQVGVGAANPLGGPNPLNIPVDLAIFDHGWGGATNPITYIPGNYALQVFDDNGNDIFDITNTGATLGTLIHASSGTANMYGNDLLDNVPALEVSDLSATLSAPILAATGQGFISIGTWTPVAQVDINPNTAVGGYPASYLFHVGTQTPTSEDYFAIHSSGYIGMGAVNDGQALVSISDVYSSGLPQLLIDDGDPTHVKFMVLNNTAQIGPCPAPEGVGSGDFATWALSVDGQIVAKEVVVTTSGWCDTVFSSTYELPALEDVANYIEQNKHLPGIPSEREVIKSGISVGDMNKKLLQKVEELTLYVMDLKKENTEIKELLKQK